MDKGPREGFEEESREKAMSDEKDIKLTDYAPPTEGAPTTIKEMIERRRELDAGRNIASLHQYARMYIPGLRSKVMNILNQSDEKDIGLLRRALSFVREKAGGYRQVLTDQELRKAQQVYQRVVSLFHETDGNPDVPPNEALAIVNECYTFVSYLLEHYSDRNGINAIHEIELFLDLAGLARAQYGWWAESSGYIMPYKKWKELGMPNVSTAIPAGAQTMISSKETKQVSKGSEDTGLTDQEVLARLPKIETPEQQGDSYDLHGSKTRRGFR